MNGIALVGQRKREHFDLGELMDAIQAFRSAARRTGFRTEAVADATVLQRQLLSIQRLISNMPPSVISAVATRFKSVFSIE